MLYFDYEDVIIYKNMPKNNYEVESFMPTKEGMNKGFLLWFTYTTYDSFRSYEDLNVCVVDLYETYEDASKMASLIRKFLDTEYYKRTQSKIENEFFYAAKTDKTPYLPIGWGNVVKDIFVDELEVSNKIKKKRVF